MSSTKRLASLDILRGADIFFLTVICFMVDSIHHAWPLPEALMAQFRHPAWVGFSVLDMVMPLFIFMSGAALPLALPKRLEADGSAGWRYWRHRDPVVPGAVLLGSLAEARQGRAHALRSVPQRMFVLCSLAWHAPRCSSFFWPHRVAGW